MRRLGRSLLIALATLSCAASAKEKERQWKDGVLVDVASESRAVGTYNHGQVTDSGQVNLYGGTRWITIWAYAIDDGDSVLIATRDLHTQWDKPFKATVKNPIKFAVEKQDVYVLDEDGKEHKLALQEKVPRANFHHFVKRGDSATHAAAAQVEIGTVRVSSTPESAEIVVDGNFMGNLPATIKLAPGKHEIRASAKGYRDVSRTIEVTAGSELTLSVVLEKE